MTEPLDAAHLQGWIGREDVSTDLLAASLVERFCATFGLSGVPARAGDPAPRLIHFCLCQPAAPAGALSEDGHPARGGFLPPVPLPRRMWAASDIVFDGDLLVGDVVTRHSTIADVVVKEGRSGTLCFVTVDHELSTDRGVAARDRQTIVYRGAADRAAPAAAPPPAPAGATSVRVDPTATLLFRYSALTFNGHRIHYDRPYATGVEGYAGLVVHGPLQATLLLQRATALMAGRAPDEFRFRSSSTLLDDQGFHLQAGLVNDGSLTLWTARADGPVAMQAEARWA